MLVINRADIPKGWQKVTHAESRAVCEGREVFNGCTGVYLEEQYGSGVVRVSGVGWFRKVDA